MASSFFSHKAIWDLIPSGMSEENMLVSARQGWLQSLNCAPTAVERRVSRNSNRQHIVEF
jgi:hypothetical protein